PGFSGGARSVAEDALDAPGPERAGGGVWGACAPAPDRRAIGGGRVPHLTGRGAAPIRAVKGEASGSVGGDGAGVGGACGGRACGGGAGRAGGGDGAGGWAGV